MDYVAGILELIGIYLVGNKSRLGFILNALGCATWVGIAINREIYGLLIVVVPAFFLNIRNYFKWMKGN